MTQNITAITVVSDSKEVKEYQRGDIGQPMSQRWLLCCPGCGNLGSVDLGKITKHDDGTVSSTQPLHCHGSKMKQRYSIEKNAVRWL